MPSYRSARACVVGAALFFPPPAAGDEIRVCFVPSQDVATAVQTRALKRAMVEHAHWVREVKDLADADVLLQFTDYRIEHRKKDGPSRWWHGTVTVLLRGEAERHDLALALHLPERFALVIMGEDAGSEMERTVAALEHFLRRALGRGTPQDGGEAI